MVGNPAEDFTSGYTMVNVQTDLLCVSEMRIGNTTPAAILAAALYLRHRPECVRRGA
ncbi:nicotinate-nucleotide--dimethylbenzimidazole phosphoribosyltransferase [Gluconacetobacter liquefaciens]|uniref:Phosphoribosyltransferase-like protein n=1 Tax=Gluconacetobacter liquefaciens TaxID=89584 RepID=A0A370G4Z4_GLULI|nr:phosphoribosyltransferase-like protein [Gluconacetobacter liquefaciens]